MAEEIPMIPKVDTLYINTGNIVNWNRLKKKPKQSPTEEIAECISDTIEGCLAKADRNKLQVSTDLNCVNEKFQENLFKDSEKGNSEGDDLARGDLKISVKIFLCSIDIPSGVSFITEAISKALESLKTNFIDSALISFPDLGDDENLTLKMIEPFWQELEKLQKSEKVYSIGISDLDKSLLEELYNWAEIKPAINQVNLESCCVMPKDLTQYAQENDIQLLTHNDPKDILTAETMNKIIGEQCTVKDGEGWEPDWALRYSGLIKCRGIIKTKGYFVKATRDTKKRKFVTH